MDVSKFLPGLEEPLVVLVRSDGNAMYVAKDIGTQLWKVGLFEGMKFTAFDTQPSGKNALHEFADRGDAPGRGAPSRTAMRSSTSLTRGRATRRRL